MVITVDVYNEGCPISGNQKILLTLSALNSIAKDLALIDEDILHTGFPVIVIREVIALA